MRRKAIIYPICLVLVFNLLSCVTTPVPTEKRDACLLEKENDTVTIMSGVALGAAAGAITGAIIAKQSGKSTGKGAAIGAVSGALAGLLMGSYIARKNKTRSRTEIDEGWDAKQGTLLRIKKAYADPPEVKPGDTVKLMVQYAVLWPDKEIKIPIKETREWFYQESEERFGKPMTEGVEICCGTWDSEFPFYVDEKTPMGVYTVLATVETDSIVRKQKITYKVTDRPSVSSPSEPSSVIEEPRTEEPVIGEPKSEKSIVVVTADVLNVRSGPGGEDNPVIIQVKKNDRLEILAQSGKWYKIKTSDGRTGWVHSRYVKSVSE